MIEATLCLLTRGHPPREILLGFKKTGFGVGKYGGFGGKVQAGETVIAAAIRELEEESSLRAAERDLRWVAHLTFLFPAKPAWSQVVHVFLVTRWQGKPVESVEMKPAWFPVCDIPYERMWQDCAHWMPPVLAGQRIRARFTFQADNETVDQVTMEAWQDDGPAQ